MSRSKHLEFDQKLYFYYTSILVDSMQMLPDDWIGEFEGEEPSIEEQLEEIYDLSVKLEKPGIWEGFISFIWSNCYRRTYDEEAGTLTLFDSSMYDCTIESSELVDVILSTVNGTLDNEESLDDYLEDDDEE